MRPFARGGMSKLIVSIVVYRSPLPVLERNLICLRQAGENAVAGNLIEEVRAILVDNASGEEYKRQLQSLVCRHQEQGFGLQLVMRPDNGGYGLGHNEVSTAPEDFRLVLNPDVFLEPQSLVAGLAFLHAHPQVGLVVPWAEDEHGVPLFLCKRYPSVLVLGLRGFAPSWLKRAFRGLLEKYEMRDVDFSMARRDLEVVSGCCLLLRGKLWQEMGGFDHRYFLYFEDFDFSLRARRITQVAYLPEFRIVHLGGNAARKGWRHRIWFVRSAAKFFNQYGWRWI